MRALSLWQPWASLIADGRKKIETRHWEMTWRGPLAIHAAKKVDRCACVTFGFNPDTIPRGAVLCTVLVVACSRFPCPSMPSDVYGNFDDGRFGILMELMEIFNPPILAVGHQGLWNWERP
jgi:hypothetical protein